MWINERARLYGMRTNLNFKLHTRAATKPSLHTENKSSRDRKYSLILPPREARFAKISQKIFKFATTHRPDHLGALSELLLLSRFLQAFFTLVEKFFKVGIFQAVVVHIWPTIGPRIMLGWEKGFPREDRAFWRTTSGRVVRGGLLCSWNTQPASYIVAIFTCDVGACTMPRKMEPFYRHSASSLAQRWVP